jgi:hypothetical protein
MDLDQLREHLQRIADSLKHTDKKLLTARLKGLVSVFPFSEYEYTLMFLRDRSVITLEQYEKLRSQYVSTNKYLDLFGLAPRIFGEIWGQEHIRDLDGRFQKPTKTLDKKYHGEYDVWIDGIKVEVKAARAIDTSVRGSLTSKALAYSSKKPFWMNFQQIKTGVADVFIFIGVWVDQIVYWVLSDDQVKSHPRLSHQHRGGIEYQIGITDDNMKEFEKYAVPADKVAETVLKKAGRKSH